MFWSHFILNEVIFGAHFRLFVSEFHKDATLKLNLFLVFLAVLHENLKSLVSGFVVITVSKNIDDCKSTVL